MKKDLSKTYREINIMLDLLGDAFKERLPKTMIPFFKEHEDKSHNPKITLTEKGFSKNLQTDTFVLMSMMYINYWCENPDEKEELKKQWMERERSTTNYDVFSKDAYKNNVGINAATAAYKDTTSESYAATADGVAVDMNKYGNLFDGGSNSTSNANLVSNVSKVSNIQKIFAKIADSLKGLFATFSKK